MSKQNLPQGWPEGFIYTPLLYIDNKGVSPALKSRLAQVLAPRLRRAGPVTKVKIKPITDQSHPAVGQRGLYAARKLDPGEWVIDYAGELLPDVACNPDSHYCLAFKEGHSIDANLYGNEARFLNDFRGIAEKNNVEFSEHTETKVGDLAVFGYRVGKKPIKRGQELLTTYGKAFWASHGESSAEEGFTSNCPGRHGLDQFAIPEGASYLCLSCTTPATHENTDFRYCKRCNYGMCSTCYTGKWE